MSKNWLTISSGSKPPALPEKKAELAARQESFARKVQELRVATGRLETRRMNFICAATSGTFSMILDRLNPSEPFRMVCIETHGPGASGSAVRSGQQVHDADSFDTSGFKCPCCGCDDYVYCDWCKANVCKGRTQLKWDGSQDYRCHDGCNATGELISYDKVHVEEHRRGLSTVRRAAPMPSTPVRPAGPSAPALPVRPSFPALPPGGKPPLLGGPRR